MSRTSGPWCRSRRPPTPSSAWRASCRRRCGPGSRWRWLEDVLAALARGARARRHHGGDGRSGRRRAGAALRRARRRPTIARGGHTAVVAAAARLLATEGRGGMLQMPGDIPLVTADEITFLLAQHGAQLPPSPSCRPMTRWAPMRCWCRRPARCRSPSATTAISPHLATARRHGIKPRIVRLPGIGRDIDTPEDIAAFARHALRAPGRRPFSTATTSRPGAMPARTQTCEPDESMTNDTRDLLDRIA